MDLLKEQNQHFLEVLSNIDFSSIIEDIKSNQNNINKFFNNLENQIIGALNNFVEKITNSDFNSIKETLSWIESISTISKWRGFEYRHIYSSIERYD